MLKVKNPVWGDETVKRASLTKEGTEINFGR